MMATLGSVDKNGDLQESFSHSFITRIWIEETANEAKKAKWRGQIIHVGSGEHAYFEDLEKIDAFIEPYIREAGVQQPFRGKIRDFIASLLAREIA